MEAETISLAQRATIERLSRDCGGAVQTISSQALEIDNIPIALVPAVLDALAQVGFVPQGGGEKPARRVTPCVRAGACPRERFDVTPYAIAVAAYSQQIENLKLKIAFSGCPSDCALASVADLGFMAQSQEGAEGFCVYAGGTPEPDPAIGVQIEAFVSEDDVFAVVEAVTRLLNQRSDSISGSALRLCDIIERLGTTEFIRCYREQRAAITLAGGNDIVLRLSPED